MTKKDYILIAKIIIDFSKYVTETKLNAIIENTINSINNDNNNNSFDVNKFKGYINKKIIGGL